MLRKSGWKNRVTKLSNHILIWLILLTGGSAYAQDSYPELTDSLSYVNSEATVDSLLREILLEENEFVLYDQEASDWIKRWFTGSPTVTIYLPNYITKFAECHQYYDVCLFWLFLEYKQNPELDRYHIQEKAIEKTLAYYQNNPSCEAAFLDKISKMSDNKRAKYLRRKA